MDIAFAMELLFQVVPPDDSQVVRVPAMSLDHIRKAAIGTETKPPMMARQGTVGPHVSAMTRRTLSHIPEVCVCL